MCALSYACMTFTFTQWPWHLTLTEIFLRSTDTPKMKFAGQGIPKLEPKQDRQTDMAKCITTPHWAAVETSRADQIVEVNHPRVKSVDADRDISQRDVVDVVSVIKLVLVTLEQFFHRPADLLGGTHRVRGLVHASLRLQRTLVTITYTVVRTWQRQLILVYIYTHCVSLLFIVRYSTCVSVLFCILLVWSCGLSAFY